MKRNDIKSFKDLPWDNDFRIIAVPYSEKCGDERLDKMRDSLNKDIPDLFCGLLGPMDEDAPGFGKDPDLGEWDWTAWCDMSDCDDIMAGLSRKYPEFAFAVFFDPMTYWGRDKEEQMQYEKATAAGAWKREYYHGKAYLCETAYVSGDNSCYDYDFTHIDETV